MTYRHRFLVTFIEWVLAQGPSTRVVRNVIMNLLCAATETAFPETEDYWKLAINIRSLVPSSFPQTGPKSKRRGISNETGAFNLKERTSKADRRSQLWSGPLARQSCLSSHSLNIPASTLRRWSWLSWG